MKLSHFLLGLFVFLAIFSGGSLFWLDRQFEEPAAKLIPSVAGVAKAKSVLAVFAHPDDEQLVTGLLIRARELDAATTRMITSTRGEAGTQLPQISRQEELGIIRHAEVLKSGYALGVSEQLVWEYPDGGLSGVDYNSYVSRLQEKMIEWQPDLVVTFWPGSGFSDHPDHKMVGKATREAVTRLQASNPVTAPKAIAYVLAPRAMMRRFAGDTGKKIAANQPEPTHAMPGEGWAKIRGWDIHASQKGYVQEAYGMPPWLVHRLYDKEHYHLVVF